MQTNLKGVNITRILTPFLSDFSRRSVLTLRDVSTC